LHPALQRNLFAFLLRFAQANGCHIFLTTHSQVAIDLYHGEEDAQIIHVRKEGEEVVGRVLEEYSHGYGVLDDIGAKASDILQANGIIWIEGPSDRVYLNRFIELWSGGALKEGLHYQFVFYGGSVLANIDASVPDSDLEEAISAFRINRNFLFVCDSDRNHSRGVLKSRVTKLLSELAGDASRVWVTRCKEIENYIPVEAFSAVHGKAGLPQIGEYEYIQEYLRRNGISTAQEYTGKHQKAVQYSEYFTMKNLAFRPELDKEITGIVETVRRWNA